VWQAADAGPRVVRADDTKEGSAVDGHRFDAFARSLAAPRPRRAVHRALLAAAGTAALGARRAGAEPSRPCTGSHFECRGKQLCQFDDATQQLRCADVEGFDHSEWRVCKGEFEFTYCQRGAICCVYPEVRDSDAGPVLQLVANCCADGRVCDPEAGCVAPPVGR
jgi:hypothetical protein